MVKNLSPGCTAAVVKEEWSTGGRGEAELSTAAAGAAVPVGQDTGEPPGQCMHTQDTTDSVSSSDYSTTIVHPSVCSSQRLSLLHSMIKLQTGYRKNDRAHALLSCTYAEGAQPAGGSRGRLTSEGPAARSAH